MEPPFVGDETCPIQIDESYFAGRRKYSWGRLLVGDGRDINEIESDEEEFLEWNSTPNPEYIVDATETCGQDDQTWRWVLGIYKDAEHVRFFRVKNQKLDTLVPIIEKYVSKPSWIYTDELKSYKCLNDLGYHHKTVNHSQNYVNPISKAHTQGIERAWIDAKSWYRRSRGNRQMLQSHLNEASWRKLRSRSAAAGTLFSTFIIDLSRTFATFRAS